MKRKFQVGPGQGPIDIIGDAQQSILLLHNQPIQFSWFAEIGTTWRYHIATALSSDAIIANEKVDKLLGRGIKFHHEFDRVVKHYETLFSEGSYICGFYEIPADIGIIDFPNEAEKDFVCFDYYGDLIDISPTQVAYDENRVKFYQSQINDHFKPAAVLLHIYGSPMLYILDGHHKLYAYGRLRKSAPAIIFSKKDTSNLSSAKAIELAKLMGCYNESYHKSIEMKKKNLFYFASNHFSIDQAFSKVNLKE